MTNAPSHHRPAPVAHAPGWGPPQPPPRRPDLPPPPDPGWQAPPPSAPGWGPAPTAGAGSPFPPSPPTEWQGSTPPLWGPPVPPSPPSPPVPPISAEDERPDRSRPPVGLQNLLLGVGTALVAISVIVFTAVNWRRLDASMQGLLLVAVTVAAGVAAVGAVRRRMPATAEALGAVAVLLALADVHAVRVGLAPAAAPSPFWAGGVALVAALAALLGRAGRIRSPQIAAGVLAQVPLLLVLDAVGATLWAAQLALVAQASLVLIAVDRVIVVPRWCRRAASLWAVATVAAATAATVVAATIGDLLATDGAASHRPATGLCLAAAALLAAEVSWLRSASDEIRPMALFGATAMGLAAIWFGAVDALGSSTTLGLLAVASALVLAASRRVPAAWGDPPAITAGLIGSCAALPLVGAVASMLVAASNASAEAWSLSGSQAAADLQLTEAPAYGAMGIALQLVAVAIALLALVRRSSQIAMATCAAVVALVGLVVGPLLAPITITTTVLVALGAVVVATTGAAALGARRPIFPIAVGFALAAWAWATPWSLATPGLTFAALATGIVACAAIALVARRDGAVEVAASATVGVVAASPLLAGLIAWDQGMSAALAWALAAAVAATLSIVGVILLDPSGIAARVSRVMREAVEATALVAYLGALVGAVVPADPDAASVALAAGVIGFGLHAVRPHRMVLGLVAAVELLALIWLHLGQADVAVVEAYTLPLAAVLLGVGLVGARLDRSGDPLPSWVAYGPALVVGLAPTVWLAFEQPGSLRPLVGLVAGALVLVVGVAKGRRALVDVGTATVALLGLQQLAPVVGEIPNWATIGATGIVLIGVGATFEQRRRDLKAVLRRYSALT